MAAGVTDMRSGFNGLASKVQTALEEDPRPWPMWRRQWQQVIPFFSYPPEVLSIIYTTNAIESLHMRLRKIVKNRGHFPSDAAASKLLFLPCVILKKIGSCHSGPGSKLPTSRHHVRRPLHERD